MYKSKYHNITCKTTTIVVFKMSCTYIPESHLLVLTQIHYYQNITFTFHVKTYLWWTLIAVLALLYVECLECPLLYLHI